jgi:predicted membrane-bound dolichyl-phosphate-mannose-protein mannosyltransferase
VTKRRPSPPTSSSIYWGIAAIGLVGLFCLQAGLAIPKLSATQDESVHLLAGYSYWRTRDFRINPEHPPLAKLVAAIPALALNPRLDTSNKDWQSSAEYPLGFSFLYGNDADRLLFWGRLPIVVIAAIGAFITFLWARDLFGPMAGAFAAGLYSFCPNLLAHGMLITTDVPVATFTLLTLYLFWRQGSQPNWRNSLVTGLALGATMATKYSGGLLPVLIAGLAVFRAIRRKDRRQAFKAEIQSLSIMAGACLLVIEATYLFSASPLLYFKNATLVNANHDPNYQYYLMGQLKTSGWWYYFLAAFAFKATLATLLLLLLRAVQTMSGRVNRWGESILQAGIGFYVVVISAGADDLGIRYLMPIFPLIYVWVSGIVPAYSRTRMKQAVLVALLGWQVWASVSSFPNYIPYFNELAGGPSAGPNLLDDSNVDWGQNLKQAGTYVEQKGIQHPVYSPISSFDNPRHYGLDSDPHPPGEFVSRTPPPGTYLISGHNVAWLRAVDPAWKRYTPVDRIGGLWIYQF